MKLSKDQKADLKSLVEHRGFKLLEEIFQDKKLNLLNQFMTADLGKEETRHSIYWTQNFVNWMESLIKTAKWLTAEKVDRVESLR